MRAENITKEMERNIIDTWMNLRSSSHEPTADEVRARVVRQLEMQGYTEHELPKLRTFQEYIRRARKRNIAFKGLSSIDESLTWSIQILDVKEYEISPDTIPFVMNLWRYCKNLGPELTIRQAKWATRLSHLLKDMDVAEQWINVVRYSTEQELSILSGTDMRTNQLNSLLVMKPWERMTLAETDVKYKLNQRLGHPFIHYGLNGGIIEEFFYAFSDIARNFHSMYLEHKVPKDYERVEELEYLLSSLPASSKFFPDFESRMVYLRHLAKLSHLPYFKNAEPKEVCSLVSELRTWIVSSVEESKRIENLKKENTDDTEERFDMFAHVLGFPMDIYQRAGYSLEEEAKEIETELRKIHPDYFDCEGEEE